METEHETSGWNPGDVARAYIMTQNHIQEITVMAHDPEFPGKLTGGGIVTGTMIKKFNAGESFPYPLPGALLWADIEEVDRQMDVFRKMGYTVEYAPGCGPESRALQCGSSCGHEKVFGGCVKK